MIYSKMMETVRIKAQRLRPSKGGGDGAGKTRPEVSCHLGESQFQVLGFRPC